MDNVTHGLLPQISLRMLSQIKVNMSQTIDIVVHILCLVTQTESHKRAYRNIFFFYI